MPLGEPEYREIVETPLLYRNWVDESYIEYPELFPQEMADGYKLHGKLPESKKLPEIRLRRIKLSANDEVYTIRPSFVLPYMVGYTDDVVKWAVLLNFGVPYWLVTHVCGRDDMYWQRLEMSFGRNSFGRNDSANGRQIAQRLKFPMKNTLLSMARRPILPQRLVANVS